MPNAISGDGTVFSNTFSVPADGDVAGGPALETAFQKLLNNAKHLYDRVYTQGVLAFRSVPDIAGLKALSGMTTGQIVRVGHFGTYTFDALSLAAVSEPWVVQPTVDDGRWFHAMAGLRNAANGFPSLDASAVIANAQSPGMTLVTRSPLPLDILAGITSLPPAGNVAIYSGIVFSSPKAGDQLQMNYGVNVALSAGVASDRLETYANFGGAIIQAGVAQNLPGAGGQVHLRGNVIYSASSDDETAGTITVSIRVASVAGGVPGGPPAGQTHLTDLTLYHLRP